MPINLRSGLDTGISVSGDGHAAKARPAVDTEQSVTGLGRSFAGGAAMAEDASTIYYNPAGITRLKEEIVTGASLIKSQITLSNVLQRCRGRAISMVNELP